MLPSRNPQGGPGHIFKVDLRARTVQTKSIGAFGFPLAMLAVNSVRSRHLITFDFSAEGKHVASLGAEYDVMHVDGPFNSAGLVRALEVTRQLIAILLDFDVFRRTPAIVDVLRVNPPIARDIVRRLLRRRFLRQGGAAKRDEHEDQQR
jgi:hypothetical protein